MKSSIKKLSVPDNLATTLINVYVNGFAGLRYLAAHTCVGYITLSGRKMEINENYAITQGLDDHSVVLAEKQTGPGNQTYYVVKSLIRNVFLSKLDIDTYEEINFTLKELFA